MGYYDLKRQGEMIFTERVPELYDDFESARNAFLSPKLDDTGGNGPTADVAAEQGKKTYCSET